MRIVVCILLILSLIGHAQVFAVSSNAAMSVGDEQVLSSGYKSYDMGTCNYVGLPFEMKVLLDDRSRNKLYVGLNA